MFFNHINTVKHIEVRFSGGQYTFPIDDVGQSKPDCPPSVFLTAIEYLLLTLADDIGQKEEIEAASRVPAS